MGGIASYVSDKKAISIRAEAGAPAHHIFADIDPSEFSDGYAIGAAFCAVLLLLEIIFVKGILS